MKTVATKPTLTKSTVEVPPLTSNLAIIKKDPAVISATQEVPPIRRAIDSLAVTDQSSSESMTDLVAQCVRTFKSTEAIRKRFVEPLNQHVSFVNSFFRKITEPAKEAENAGRAKLNAYLQQQYREAQAQAARDAKAYERKFERAEAKGVAPPPPPVEVEYQSGVTTESAAASTRMVPKFKLGITQTITEVDPVKHVITTNSRPATILDVDPEYLMLDEAKVRRVLKAGIRQIKGLEIWEEPEAAIYT